MTAKRLLVSDNSEYEQYQTNAYLHRLYYIVPCIAVTMQRS
jgi:hypothetical protein